MTFSDRLWAFITSVKLTLYLLLGITILLVLGTYVETTQGNTAAIAIIYRSPFMDGLILLLAINQITCTIKRYPYKPHQAGWLLTHVGVLMILFSSIYGRRLEQEGTIVLPEGGTTDYYVMEHKVDGRPQMWAVPLGFEISLDQFKVEKYPGTQMASDFTSHIRVEDIENSRAVEHDIKVNHPLKYNGFVIAQQSYMVGDRTSTVLSVLKNPGTPAVFFGFIVLSVGIMIIVFIKPILKRKFPPAPKRVTKQSVQTA
ncbi:cytochrome c biogenesis protein ResB [bacterium]|nr:cytochrome c biogenesis protein ResB [bacterium]